MLAQLWLRTAEPWKVGRVSQEFVIARNEAILFIDRFLPMVGMTNTQNIMSRGSRDNFIKKQIPPDGRNDEYIECHVERSRDIFFK